MKSKIISVFFLLLTSTISFSQESKFESATKQYSLTFGYSNVIKINKDSLAINGFSAELDYAYKLSGYNKKNASYISVPLGYGVYPATNSTKKNSILFYGWTVRHEYGRGKYRPYLSYGLLLNQLRIKGVDGSVFGHQTRSNIGVNIDFSKKVIGNIAIAYGYTRFPKLGDKQSIKMHRLGLIFGIRI